MSKKPATRLILEVCFSDEPLQEKMWLTTGDELKCLQL